MARTYVKKIAMYTMIWYDAEWNEIPTPPQLFNAGAMISCLERWNLSQQRAAQDEPFMITEVPHAVHVAIGVTHVER